jgi:hypothetical protein
MSEEYVRPRFDKESYLLQVQMTMGMVTADSTFYTHVPEDFRDPVLYDTTAGEREAERLAQSEAFGRAVAASKAKQ